MRSDSKSRTADSTALPRRVAWVASALCLVAGCSLVTTFPEIEESTAAGAAGQGGAGGGTTNVGGNGNGGGGAGAGGGECTPVLADCTDCAGTVEHCGAMLTEIGSTTLIGPPNVPTSDGFAEVTAGTTLASGAPVFAGVFQEHLGVGLQGTNKLSALDVGVGFISSADGDLLFGMSPCDGTASSMTMGAIVSFPKASPPALAVVGGFTADRLLPFNGSTNCSGSGVIPSHVGNGTITPYIYWFRENGNAMESLEPPAGEQQINEHAMFLDAAVVDAQAANPNLVAIGVTTSSAFNALGAVDGTKFFLLSAGTANLKSAKPLQFGPCQADAFNDFDRIDGSIAVDPVDGGVWVAGSDGCGGLDQPAGPQPTGFLQRWSTTAGAPGEAPTFDAATVTLPINSTNHFRVRRLVVTSDSILLAGVYTGVPSFKMAAGGDPDAGHAGGDAYVVRFPRAGFTNQSKATWFRRIASDNPLTNVLDLRADGGRIYVAGRVGTDLGIGDVFSCLTADLGGGRGFVAELDEATGAVNWMRLDGGLPQSPDGSAPPRRVSDTVVVPYGRGNLALATSSLGDVVLQCDESSTDVAKPTVTLRMLEPSP